MAGSLSLDDKLLGEKVNNYCSSSEDEEEYIDAAPLPSLPVGKSAGVQKSVNTGPKGVIQDWQRYKQLEQERREENEREKAELAHRLAMTCRTELEDARAGEEDARLMRDLEALDDDFMKEYRKQRMEEMKAALRNVPVFGEVRSLSSGESLLEAIDSAHESTTVIVFVYEPGVPGCEAMHYCMSHLAESYQSTMFIRIRAKEAQLSKFFSQEGVPALLAYRKGDLVGNFVSINKELGDDFFTTDVENYLQSHGLLPDESPVHKTIRESADK